MKKEKKSIWKRWYMGVLYCFVGLILILAIGDIVDTSSTSTTTKTKVSTYKIEKTAACVMAQQFVEDKLKAPSTAKFKRCYDDDITYLGDQTYMVYSYVDSQNGFGAMLRTKYIAEIKDKQNGYWSLIDLATY